MAEIKIWRWCLTTSNHEIIEEPWNETSYLVVTKRARLVIIDLRQQNEKSKVDCNNKPFKVKRGCDQSMFANFFRYSYILWKVKQAAENIWALINVNIRERNPSQNLSEYVFASMLKSELKAQ